tara:strand:+ start:5387 stop:5806 length:420 start_codon:yes stop_codon:yes gene_type:complete
MMEDDVSDEFIRAYRSNQIFNINRAIGRYMQLEDMAIAGKAYIRTFSGTGSTTIPTTIRVYLGICGFYEDTETDELESTLDERAGFDEEKEVDLLFELLEQARLNCFYKKRELNAILEQNIRSGATVKASTMDRYVVGD